MTALWKHRLAGVALAAGIFAADQGIKRHLVRNLQLERVRLIELIPFFDLRWTENRGVSLGMFTADSMEMRLALLLVTAGIAFGVLIWLLRERARSDIFALALVLGGAAGNIVDRYTRGYVIDYADLHFGTFRPFLIFNLADAAITIGVLILLARAFLLREKRPDPAERPPGETRTAADPATENS